MKIIKNYYIFMLIFDEFFFGFYHGTLINVFKIWRFYNANDRKFEKKKTKLSGVEIVKHFSKLELQKPAVTI